MARELTVSLSRHYVCRFRPQWHPHPEASQGRVREIAIAVPAIILFVADVRTLRMPRTTISFDTVRKIGLALPNVEASTAWGAPALKIQGKLMACVPTHRSAEPNSLAIRVGFDDRAELLAAAPDIYYVTDHYIGYTAVLLRLSRVTPGVLRDLLGMAHKFVNARRRR